jgi:hypothetical protein
MHLSIRLAGSGFSWGGTVSVNAWLDVYRFREDLWDRHEVAPTGGLNLFASGSVTVWCIFCRPQRTAPGGRLSVSQTKLKWEELKAFIHKRQFFGKSCASQQDFTPAQGN